MDRKRNTKAKGRRNLRQKAVREPGHIPQIRSNVILRHKYRFRATADIAATQITVDNVLGACGVIGTVVNTTAVEMMRSVRIRNIEIWSPTGTSSTPATCAIDFTSAVVQSANLEYSDTSINVSSPAHVRCRPPPQSLASFWQVTSSNILFTLTVTSGSIIDLDVDCILTDSPTITTVALTTVALGAVYYLSLNGSTATIVPVALKTTT